jgi:hypothetical protein
MPRRTITSSSRMTWTLPQYSLLHRAKNQAVQIRSEQLNPEVIGKQVVLALRQMAKELEEGALVTVDPERTRVRVLPLQIRN